MSRHEIFFSFRFKELEERERNLYASQGRNEVTIQGLQRDVKYHEEKVREYDKKIRQLEHNISEEIQLKERARLNLQVPYNAPTGRSLASYVNFRRREIKATSRVASPVDRTVTRVDLTERCRSDRISCEGWHTR